MSTTGSPTAAPPAPPGPGPGAPRRRTWLRVLVVLVVVGAVALTLAVVALVLVVRRLETPASVPDGWSAPTGLPAGAGTVPDDAIAFDGDGTGTFELYLLAADGSTRQLTDDPTTDAWWPRVSPDRRTILYYRTPAGTHDRDYTATSLWATDAAGSEHVQLRPAGLDGWVQQGHAEWSPEGDELVMFGGSRLNPQIFVTDALGQGPRQVTDDGGTNIDPSWHPDGRSLVYVGCPSSICRFSDYEIYAVDVDGGPRTRLTDDGVRDHDPYVSPDGTRLAWLSQVEGGITDPVGAWDIRLADVVGDDPLAVGPIRRLVGDDQVTSRPEWTRDGTGLVFHRLTDATGGFELWAADPDGSDLRRLAPDLPGTQEYPST